MFYQTNKEGTMNEMFPTERQALKRRKADDQEPVGRLRLSRLYVVCVGRKREMAGYFHCVPCSLLRI